MHRIFTLTNKCPKVSRNCLIVPIFTVMRLRVSGVGADALIDKGVGRVHLLIQ